MIEPLGYCLLSQSTVVVGMVPFVFCLLSAATYKVVRSVGTEEAR